MGNGYNHHKTLHHLHLHHKTTFLPMLCSKPSIKDVAIIPKCEYPSSSSSSSSSSNEPLSPKISCMGQVVKPNYDDKKLMINLGFHHHKIQVSSTTPKNIINPPIIKYFKLKKIFFASNKNYNNNNRNCGRRSGNGTKIVNDGGDGKENNSCGCVNIVEMDPPLPVIRKVKPVAADGDGDGGGGGVESLWKRRCGGVSLKSLRVQHIQINSHGIQQQASIV